MGEGVGVSVDEVGSAECVEWAAEAAAQPNVRDKGEHDHDRNEPAWEGPRAAL